MPNRGALSAGHHAKSGRIRSGATLVVCNVSLVSQWYDEAISKLSLGGKSVYRYYGSPRVRDAAKLADYDIVVTTYAVLASDWKGKRKIKKAPGVRVFFFYVQ
jgi:SNF2 family DNA or RNA helicase